ncbi:MAG: ribosome small subunit-dependent GTPase A [Lactobacillales bacterium]|nr:ribosome small subunit-dependent GTPase A [Lactobacillales bacterium]
MQGRIVKLISNDYTVLSDNKTYVCKSRGLFRNKNIKPLVGDLVIFDEENNYILEVLPRTNSLVRPPVSNIDQALIVSNVKPTFDTNLLDKLLCIIEYNNIKPIICFTKLDLLNEEELIHINKYISYYKKIGYQVFVNTEIEEIKKIFKDKITVFTGQTGAGKSTLINNIDTNFNILTGEISKALGRGRHTTRHVELHNVCGGLVADTPGFSDVDFYDMKKEDIRDNFIEFNDYKENCKFRDCMHQNEQICEVKKKLEENEIIKSRYENYLNFIRRSL